MIFSDYFRFMQDLRQNGAERAAEHAAALGFGAVELLANAPRCGIDAWTDDAAGLERALSANGLYVCCFSFAVDLTNTPPPLEYVDLAARLGAKKVHHTLLPSLDPPEKDYATALEAVIPPARAITDRCREYGVECLYEPQGMYFNGAKGLGGFLERMLEYNGNIGVCADLGNTFFADEDPFDVYGALKEHIRHVHVKNYAVSYSPPEGAYYVSRGGRYICDAPLDGGTADIRACFELIRGCGYDGEVSFEFSGSDGEIAAAMEYLERL